MLSFLLAELKLMTDESELMTRFWYPHSHWLSIFVPKTFHQVWFICHQHLSLVVVYLIVLQCKTSDSCTHIRTLFWQCICALLSISISIIVAIYHN